MMGIEDGAIEGERSDSAVFRFVRLHRSTYDSQRGDFPRLPLFCQSLRAQDSLIFIRYRNTFRLELLVLNRLVGKDQNPSSGWF